MDNFYKNLSKDDAHKLAMLEKNTLNGQMDELRGALRLLWKAIKKAINRIGGK